MRTAWLVALAACSFPTKHFGADDATSADAVADAMTDAATPFGCMGQPFQTTAPPQIMISGQALDLGTGVAATGVTVTAMLDDGSSALTTTTDAQGNFVGTVQTGGAAVPAYIVTTAGTYVPSYYYPSHPFDADSVTALPMLTASELTQIGNPDNSALGELLLGDCLGTGIAGCTLSIEPRAPMLIEYSVNGTPSKTATSTDMTGYVLVYGLAPGASTFQATCPSGALRATSIDVVANATYFVRIEP